MLAEVDMLPRHHQQKLTMSVFWPPSLLCSIRPMIPLRLMLGFAPLRISSASSIAQKWTKPPLQRNSYEDLQKYGGSITRLYFPPIHVSPGMSLWQLLKPITSLQA